MKWKTSISSVKNDQAEIRGRPLFDLAQKQSFVKNIYFILTGKDATDEIEQLMNLMMSLCLDHGLGTVSTLASRIAASADVPLQQSLIAALASMGHAHGGATQDAAEWFRRAQSLGADVAIAEAVDNKRRIPGFGHKILERDERSELLFQRARELNLYGEYCEFAVEVEKKLMEMKGKPIPLNIDGAIAAMGLDLGFAPDIMTGLFILGRLPGLMAHIQEERQQKNGPRRLDEEEIERL